MSYVFTPESGHANNPGYSGLARSYVAEMKTDGTYSLLVGRTRETFARSRTMYIGPVTENNPQNVGFFIHVNGEEVLIMGTLQKVTSNELNKLLAGGRRRRTRNRRSRTRRSRTRRSRTRSRK
jgi:hypothetical protein